MCCTRAEFCLLVMQFMPDRLTESTSDNALTGTRSVAGLFVFIAAWHEWAAVCIELTGGYCDSAVEKTNNRTDKKEPHVSWYCGNCAFTSSIYSLST